MKYHNIIKAIFIDRPNRFLAKVRIDGVEEFVHVKNTGRCKEILIPGTEVYLEESNNTARKTKYSLISAYKGEKLINIDSQSPNAVIFESLKQEQIQEIGKTAVVKREVPFGDSRFDIYFENQIGKGFIEIKGATLECDGLVMFPDAPTERGRKHVYEMIKAVESGYLGFILFLIQMKGVKSFAPNVATDPEFAKALRLCAKSGVNILAYDSIIQKDEIRLGDKVPIIL